MQRSDVRITALPAFSALNERVAAADFIDCYSVPATLSPRQAATVSTEFPSWAQYLLVIRRWVTTPFGLKNDEAQAADNIGIFPVETENARELIAGFDDKHLDFRISVVSDSGHVYLSTWVHPHNFGGRLYLATIMPFHVLIVRDALARVAAAQNAV